jgi:hypothetical protein
MGKEKVKEGRRKEEKRKEEKGKGKGSRLRKSI